MKWYFISSVVVKNQLKDEQSSKEFNDYRSKMNEKLLNNNKIVKRIFNLDTNAYAEGALT